MFVRFVYYVCIMFVVFFFDVFRYNSAIYYEVFMILKTIRNELSFSV